MMNGGTLVEGEHRMNRISPEPKVASQCRKQACRASHPYAPIFSARATQLSFSRERQSRYGRILTLDRTAQTGGDNTIPYHAHELFKSSNLPTFGGTPRTRDHRNDIAGGGLRTRR